VRADAEREGDEKLSGVRFEIVRMGGRVGEQKGERRESLGELRILLGIVGMRSLSWRKE
jgi:hypothetical protein